MYIYLYLYIYIYIHIHMYMSITYANMFPGDIPDTPETRGIES